MKSPILASFHEVDVMPYKSAIFKYISIKENEIKQIFGFHALFTIRCLHLGGTGAEAHTATLIRANSTT